MANLNPRQESLLADVRKAREAYLNAKQFADVRARQLAAQEVAQHLAAQDVAVRAAFEADVPKARIGQDGLGTKAPKTLADSLARTEHLARQQSQAAQVEALVKEEPKDAGVRYLLSHDGQTLTITLSGRVLEEAATDQDWTVADVEKHDLARAMFHNGGHMLDPISPDFLPEYGKRHPVVVWAQDPKNEAAALAWVSDAEEG